MGVRTFHQLAAGQQGSRGSGASLAIGHGELGQRELGQRGLGQRELGQRILGQREFGQIEFAFVFEKVVLPVVQSTMPAERLPLDWHNYGNVEDSFSAFNRALNHRHSGHLSNSGRPCESCLERLVGFSPLFDRQLVLMIFLRGFGAILCSIIVASWHCISAFAIFCVAIWFVIPGLSPQERKLAEEVAARRKKQEEREDEARADSLKSENEAEERAQMEQAQHDEPDRTLLEKVNSLKYDARYIDAAKLKADELLVAEANYLTDRMGREHKLENREKDAREWNEIVRELENKRELAIRMVERSRHAAGDGEIGRCSIKP